MTVKPVDLARIKRAERSRARAARTRPGLARHDPARVGRRYLARRGVRRLRADRRPREGHQGPRRGGKLGIRDRERLALALFAPTSRYLAAVARRGGHDLALSEIRADLRSDDWYDIASGKGVLVLAELRAIMGDKPFDTFMDEFGRAHAGRPVSSAAFFEAAEKAHGKPLGDLKDAWLNGDALAKLSADARARKASGRFWSVDSFERQLDKALIVYGTHRRGRFQREAARRLQRKLAGRWANIAVPIKADTDVTDGMIKDAHILLVGRPATNRLSARLAKALPVSFGAASFTLAGETYAHPLTAIVAAGPSPWPPAARSSSSPASVPRPPGPAPAGSSTAAARAAEIAVMADGTPVRRLAVPASKDAPGVAAVDSAPAR